MSNQTKNVLAQFWAYGANFKMLNIVAVNSLRIRENNCLSVYSGFLACSISKEFG